MLIKRPKHNLKYVLSHLSNTTKELFEYIIQQLSLELVYSRHKELGIEGSLEYFTKLFDEGLVSINVENKVNEIGRNCLDVKVWWFDYGESEYVPVPIEGFEWVQEKE